MRIAFFVQSFPELSETFILNQITGMIVRGHDIDIFALYKNNPGEIHPDIEKYSLVNKTYYRSNTPNNKTARLIKGFFLGLGHFHKNPIKIFNAVNLFKFKETRLSIVPLYMTILFLKRGMYDYDIIQCHYGSIGNSVAVLRKLGIVTGKIVTMFHGIDIRMGIPSGGSIYDDLKKEGDCILSISPYNKYHLLKFGFPENRIVHHPVGVNTSFFDYADRMKKPDDKKIRILSVARLVHEKGLNFGLMALKILMERLPGYRISYRILGNGILEEELRSYAHELGVSNVVRFLGEGTDRRVKEEMRNADIFFLPSNNEALPVSIMEAMSTGLPVVASNVGSVSELVKNGASGFLVEKGDADGFAEKLQFLIQHPQVRFEMNFAGRAHIEANYDIEVLNDRLVDIYSRLLKKSNFAVQSHRRLEKQPV